MKRLLQTLALTVIVAGAPAAGRADHDDLDAWYDGEVETRIRVKPGEGAVLEPGEPVRIRFRTEADAYHLVYGIDTEGWVRVLYPRWWEDDGWVPAGRKVKLRADELAWPADRWGREGLVYLEVVASPEPFDWRALGFGRVGGVCTWDPEGVPLRIAGDPFLAFNTIHRYLFPDWNRAVFTVDYTYFYVGARCAAPRYLGYAYEPVVVRAPRSGWHVSVRFGWSWDRGHRYARPVYRRWYRPGRHVVHHHVHHVIVDRHHGHRRHDASRERVGRRSPRHREVVVREDRERRRHERIVRKRHREREPRVVRERKRERRDERIERRRPAHRVRDARVRPSPRREVKRLRAPAREARRDAKARAATKRQKVEHRDRRGAKKRHEVEARKRLRRDAKR